MDWMEKSIRGERWRDGGERIYIFVKSLYVLLGRNSKMYIFCSVSELSWVLHKFEFYSIFQQHSWNGIILWNYFYLCFLWFDYYYSSSVDWLLEWMDRRREKWRRIAGGDEDARLLKETRSRVFSYYNFISIYLSFFRMSENLNWMEVDGDGDRERKRRRLMICL